jgi:hypothetical protein
LGDSVYLVLNAGTSDKVLRIFSKSTSSQGILNVAIDEVDNTGFDQYASSVNYKSFYDYKFPAGEHLVKLSVSGLKNTASSGTTVCIDALELRNTDLTDEERAQLLIDSIVNNISLDNGASRISYDSNLYNQDNDSGYSLMALALAVSKWNIPEHAVALKKNLQWFADTVQSDGVWYWGYCKQGDTNCARSYIVPDSGANCVAGFCPSVNDYYTSLTPAITAIRSIDAPQSFPAVGLAIYASLFPGDKTFIDSIKTKIISGIDALIANNYDASNGYFYSSYQYKKGEGWQLYEVQYSAGQCDVYMGLMSAYSLTGDQKYKTYADHIKNNFDNDDFYFWN